MTTVTTLDIKSFSGVGWGLKPEVKLTGGPDYHEIELTTNLLPAEFRVELILNSDTRINLTGEQLVMLEQFKKHWVESGKFIIPLGDIVGNSQEGQMVGGMETYPADNIVLRVYVVPFPGSPRPAQVELSAAASVSPHLGGQLGADMAIYLPRLVEVTFAAGNTGKNIHDTLPQGPGMKLLRAHIGSANVSRVEIKKGSNSMNGSVVWQRDAGQNVYQLKRRGRAPQAGWFHVDLVESGFIVSDAMPLDDVLRTVFDIYVSTPGNIPILLETLEQDSSRARAAI